MRHSGIVAFCNFVLIIISYLAWIRLFALTLAPPCVEPSLAFCPKRPLITRITNMTDSYESFETEYDTALSRVRAFLSSTRSRSTLQESERLLREARRCATAMQGLAEVEGDAAKVQESKRRMDQEVRPLAEEVARALEAKRTGSTSSITSNTSAPTSTSSNIGDGLGKLRNELFGGGSARNAAATTAANETRVAEISASSGYRAPTLDNTDLEQGGVGTDHAGSASRAAAADTATDQAILESERLLLESQALCADSEQVGASTLQTLGQQREQLYMASSHLERARSSADQAKRLLRQMSNRALRNKLFLYGVIAALIIANGTVLYRIATKNK